MLERSIDLSDPALKKSDFPSMREPEHAGCWAPACCCFYISSSTRGRAPLHSERTVVFLVFSVNLPSSAAARPRSFLQLLADLSDAQRRLLPVRVTGENVSSFQLAVTL